MPENKMNPTPQNENPAMDTAIRTPRQAFFQNDFRELDRALSEQERREWNDIYASYSSHSILHGTVIGVDQLDLPARNGDGGWEKTAMSCLVIVNYRVKVLIPAPFVWTDGGEHPDYLLNAMLGAKLDYVVTAVDREGGCAVGSRAEAAAMARRHAVNVLHLAEGDKITCSVLSVGPTRLRATAHGYDFLLSQNSLSYSYIGDLRAVYHPGQELRAVVLEASEERLLVSVKLSEPNPYEGALLRHPIGSQRLATITGKYAGGVFCRLPDGCTVVCGYAQQFSDREFEINDSVAVRITGESRDRGWLRATIRGKVG